MILQVVATISAIVCAFIAAVSTIYSIKLKRKYELEDRTHNETSEMRGLKDEITAFRDEVKTIINGVKNDISAFKAEQKEAAMEAVRTSIWRFGDEIFIEGRVHSKDAWDSTMTACKAYVHYCDSHPSFENGKTDNTIAALDIAYKQHILNNDWLGVQASGLDEAVEQ